MADNNKNPRRTIWLSETEPLSHYDIWLSKNRHLNSEGETVSDSHVLRPCDYIFKVWDCDNWYPIVGFNAAAANKIDTVKDVTYSTTHNSLTITSTGYSEFHLPLFTKPEHSPSELFDGGSVGEVILEYVSDTEWELIIGHIYELENIENPYTLLPASSSNLGGIKANPLADYESGLAYGYIDMGNNSSNNNHLHHIALTGEDIYSATVTYLNTVDPNNPDFPHLNLLLATTDITGGIRADKFKNGVPTSEVKFVNNTDDTLLNYGRLYVNTDEVLSNLELATPTKTGGIRAELHDENVSLTLLVQAKFINVEEEDSSGTYGRLYVDSNEITQNTFNDPSVISDLLWNTFLNSPTIKKDWAYPYELAQKPRFSIYGSNDISNNGGKFLRLKTEQEMNALTPPSLGEEPYNENYNRLEWADISDYLGIEGGTAIEIVDGKVNLKYSSESFNVINPENKLTLKPATTSSLGGIKVGSGLNIQDGVLSVISQSSQEPTEYTGTNLIEVNSSGEIGIDMTSNPENGDVIICDSGVAKWSAMPNPKILGLSIDANNGDVTLDGLNLSDNSQMQIEDEQSGRATCLLNTWNYYNISNFKSFSITSVPAKMEPLYIRLIESSAAVTCTGDTIDIADVLSSPTGKDILITLLFGIAKFEEISKPSTEEP